MKSLAQTHDAKQVLSNLRDHLARHDKPIAFLFGAGTSCAVRVPDPDAPGETKPVVPAVRELTVACRSDAQALGDPFPAAWQLIEQHCTVAGNAATIEAILSRVQGMRAAVGPQDSLCGLGAAHLEQLEKTIRGTIGRLAGPGLDTVDAQFPHRDFARWLARTARQVPVEVFTVNYDVLIEHALELERVPLFDGFVGAYQPFFHADSLRRQEAAPGASWTRLWKMHGSVTWKRVEHGGRRRIVRGAPDPSGAMIYPSIEKYEESRQQPYSAISDRLSRFLERDDALLVVSGFSFGDEHINDVIFGALENRPRTHMYALQFEDVTDQCDLWTRALRHSNVTVVCPETGVIGTKPARWSTDDPPDFLANVFEVAGGTENADEPPSTARTGKMKIGDFCVLCDFLKSMTDH